MVILVLLLATSAPLPLHAADQLQLAEQEIKAGLLYNFLKYTQWPTVDATSEMQVCIFGDDPFEGYLQPMAGRTVQQREIVLRMVRTASEAETCHLLFINAAQRANWTRLRETLVGKNVLTVSDFSGFIDAGGILEFGRKDNRVQVYINMSALQAAGLRVHDRMLKLVTAVNPARQEEKP